ncbi:hypothetical protein BD413DRAFT_623974 [Trametes elegans]|nr:hypothetical protein BD413DRAFT_623974 [Trametes elegans]
MVDWMSPEQLVREQMGYINVVFAFFGLYIWEVFQTSDFEWSVIQRRRKIRWHWVLFLFLCRYCMIMAAVSLMASFTVIRTVNCQALYTFISWAGNMSIICASTTLMFRTIAVWNRKLAIAIPLSIICLAHWALLWRGMFIINAQYDPKSSSCAVQTTDRLFLLITFWTTTGFNLILAIVHVIGLTQRDYGASFWQMLFEDGLIFYLIAFSCNALPAVTVMNVAMAACRTVTSLSEVGESDDLYVHSATQLSGPPVPPTAVRLQTMRASRYPPRPEVHVTTDQFVLEDEGSPHSAYPRSKAPELMDDKSESDKVYNAV